MPKPSTTRSTLTLLLLLAAAWPGGCRKEPAGGGAPAAPAARPRPLVGVSLLTLTNPFFKEMGDTFTAEGARRGYEVSVVSGELDPARQKDQVKDFLVRKASVIVLTPCDSRSVGTAIAEANAAGVAVFTADVASTAPGAKVVCHTATDNREGGRIAGRAMVEMLGGNGVVAVIGHPEVESGQMRESGFDEEVSKAPGIHVVARLAASGARDRAFAVAQDLIQAHGDLDAIFAINDPTALGAIAAIEKAGRAGRIRVIGFDGQPEAKRAVRDGKLYATVLQFPGKIASMTMDSIAGYLRGEDVPPQVLIPPALYRRADAAADSELK